MLAAVALPLYVRVQACHSGLTLVFKYSLGHWHLRTHMHLRIPTAVLIMLAFCKTHLYTHLFHHTSSLSEANALLHRYNESTKEKTYVISTKARTINCQKRKCRVHF